jgi:serine/threonine-protein kinase
MDWIIMPLVVGKHRGNAIVPPIVKLTPQEAMTSVKEAGLEMQKEAEEYSDSIADKRIIKQHPASGEEIKKGRVIYYTVSKGSQNIRVPDLRGKSLRSAQLTLKSLGLKTGHIRYTYDDSIPMDNILYTQPASGITVDRETVVDLTVSQAAEPTESEVPNLLGISLDASRELIKKANLTIGSISFQSRRGVTPETVISQSLPPGGRVEKSAQINLIVSGAN